MKHTTELNDFLAGESIAFQECAGNNQRAGNTSASNVALRASEILDRAMAMLARLPDPTPPTADGKTPGQVDYEAFVPREPGDWESCVCKQNYERSASAVLAAFGVAGLDAAIARMEAVPEMALSIDTPSHVIQHIRDRLIAAARGEEGKPAAVDWKAKYEEVERSLGIHKGELSYWLQRTEWVQDSGIGLVGRHRIDIMNDYIAELRERLNLARDCAENAEARAEKAQP